LQSPAFVFAIQERSFAHDALQLFGLAAPVITLVTGRRPRPVKDEPLRGRKSGFPMLRGYHLVRTGIPLPFSGP